MKIISDNIAIDKNKWRDFVINHPYGNIFQTPAMVDVYLKTLNYKPFVLICLNDNNEIAGVLVSVIQSEHKGLAGKLSSRAIVFGGPLVKDNLPEVTRLLLESYNLNIQNKAIYTQIRNLNDNATNIYNFIDTGYRFEEHLNICIDLTKNEEHLWKSLHSKRRQQIRNSQKAGVVVSLITEIFEIKKAYKILNEVYSKACLPLADISLFINAFELLWKINHFVCFGAYLNGELIGVRFCLCYNSTIYDWYAGSQIKFNHYYPNEIIPWEIFSWGIKNNYRLFDFGGAGHPQKPYGVREYKLKFGGELINPGRYQIIHRPFLYHVSKAGFYFWQLFKKSHANSD